MKSSSFEKKIFQHIDKVLNGLPTAKKIAVAVSGGADSMALTLLLQKWAKKNRKNLIALHVDHGLRATSKKEASQVKAWLGNRKIPCQILVWRGVKPKTRIHEKARAARYALFVKALRKYQTPYLFLAHHLDDQAETVAIRWARKSGIDGLSGMQPVVQQDKMVLLRPLLNIKPSQLRTYLKKQKQPWLEDPSNTNPKFTRAKLRQNWQQLGLSHTWFADLAKELASVRRYYDQQVEAFMAAAVTTQRKQIAIDRAAFHQLDAETAKRLVRQCLQSLSKDIYPPGKQPLDKLMIMLHNPASRTARTLHGCVIAAARQEIVLTLEKRGRKKVSS